MPGEARNHAWPSHFLIPIFLREISNACLKQVVSSFQLVVVRWQPFVFLEAVAPRIWGSISHHCLPVAASRARLRALLCYVLLCML